VWNGDVCAGAPKTRLLKNKKKAEVKSLFPL